MQNTKDVIDINKLYGEQCLTDKDEFLKKFEIDEKGLTENEVDQNLKKYGKNEVKQAKPKKWYHYFSQSLFSPFNSILLGIVLILFYTDVFLPENPSFANIIVIIVLVAVSTLLEFTEEYKSNKAAQKLKELVETTTTVIRDGKKIDIPLKMVTVGDIVYLSAGSMIPADLRIIEAKDLYVGQSSLTGESDSVKKVVNTENEEEIESIFVKSDYKLVQIELKKILYVEGLKDYVKIYTEDSARPILSLMSMKSMEELLPASRFMRVHRSYIVQKEKIRVIDRGRIVFDKTYIPVSDSYKQVFQAFLDKRS